MQLFKLCFHPFSCPEDTVIHIISCDTVFLCDRIRRNPKIFHHNQDIIIYRIYAAQFEQYLFSVLNLFPVQHDPFWIQLFLTGFSALPFLQNNIFLSFPWFLKIIFCFIDSCYKYQRSQFLLITQIQSIHDLIEMIKHFLTDIFCQHSVLYKPVSAFYRESMVFPINIIKILVFHLLYNT